MSRHSFRTSIVAGCLLLACVWLASSCQSTYPRQDPTGKKLPTVRGQRLDGRDMLLPEGLEGRPSLLLVAYEMESQFDCDRWILGAVDSGLDVDLYEVPTIPGFVPGMFASVIDRGMRSGIPAEDWGSVVTVYGDAEILAEFLGNENPLPARVLLLDSSGEVRFFHDEGYSVRTLKKLAEVASRLPSAAKDDAQQRQ